MKIELNDPSLSRFGIHGIHTDHVDNWLISIPNASHGAPQSGGWFHGNYCSGDTGSEKFNDDISRDDMEEIIADRLQALTRALCVYVQVVERDTAAAQDRNARQAYDRWREGLSDERRDTFSELPEEHKEAWRRVAGGYS